MTPVRSLIHDRIEPWSGDLLIKPRKYALYLGLAAETEPHSMHVLQFFVLLDGEMRLHIWNKCRFPLRGKLKLEGESIFELTVGRPLIIPPDYPIQLEGSGNIAIFFFNPEITSAEDGPPTHQLRSSLTMLLPESVEGIVTRLYGYLTCKYSKEEVSLLCNEMTELIISLGEREPLYWLVRDTLECLFKAFENDRDSKIMTILKCLALMTRTLPSKTVIQRQFSERIGMAIRRFSIVLRLWDAVEEMAYKKNLDDVSAAVNFAKGMLSRYFKRMIGISPSMFYRRGNVLVLS